MSSRAQQRDGAMQSWHSKRLSSQSSGERVWPIAMQIDNSGAAVSEEHALGLEQFINLPSASFLCLLAISLPTLSPHHLFQVYSTSISWRTEVCIATQVSS